ncbi:MAG: tyrosine-type recombinase/integrase [Erythrobacter sp.]
MNATLPRYCSAFTDRHGKQRIRFRRTGWATRYAQAEPGTPEFTQEYRTWEREGRIQTGADRMVAGSWDDLIARFYRSASFLKRRPGTQRSYRGELERFRAKYGSRRVATMTARHVDAIMQQMQATPSAANNLKKRLGQLFDLAIVLGWRTDNPARVINSLQTPKGGFKTWQEEQIAAYEARHPVGTPARLAFDLALYTAQRRSDVCLMGPQHVKDGKIAVKQLKTGKDMTIPLHPRLRESIAATPTGHLAFIVSNRGAPRTKESFGNWFAEQCAAAGLKGYSMHGLRKAASRRMAEMGLSNQLIKSITGHTSDNEVARYTRDAEQARMAELAMERMGNWLPPSANFLATHISHRGEKT